MTSICKTLSAAALVLAVALTGASFAADSKTGKSADGVSCAVSLPKQASPAARCAAIRKQCGGKFFANYCRDKLLSAM